jgi:hypothetical protein
VIRLLLCAVCAAALLAGCGASSGLRIEGSGPPDRAAATTAVSSGTVPRPPTKPSAVRLRIPIGSPAAIAYYSGQLWVAAHPGAGRLVGTLLQLDTASGRVAGSPVQLPVSHRPYLLAVGQNGVWVGGDSEVWEIDPASGRVLAGVQVGGRPQALLEAGGWVWATVIGSNGGTLERIDPANGAITRFPVGPQPRAVTAVGRRVWVSDLTEVAVRALAARTGRPLNRTSLPVLAGHLPMQLTDFDRSLWVYEVDALARVSPASGALEKTYPLDGVRGGDMAAGSGGVWVAVRTRNGATAVDRFDPLAGDFSGDPVTVGDGPVSLATDGIGVWAMVQRTGVLVDVQPAGG